MHDIITIGSGTVDIFMKSAEFHLQKTGDGVLLCEQYGGKLNVEELEIQSGGAGTNTAVGFSRMGFKSAAIVEIGKDMFGQVVWDELKREHVDTQFVVTEKSEQTGVSVLLISGDGGRSALTHRGAAGQLEARDIPWQALADGGTRWVHLSNVMGNKELLLRLFDNISHSLVGLSWNPGHVELEMLAKKELLPAHIPCDIFMVNKEEWEQVGAEVQPQIMHHFANVVITDGQHGGEVFVQGQYSLHYTVIPVPVVQETGAGDAFLTGYVSAHLLGRMPEECCEWGKRNAASVVQNMGAKKGLLHRRDFSL